MKFELRKISRISLDQEDFDRLSPVFRVTAHQERRSAYSSVKQVKHTNEQPDPFIHFIDDGESLLGAMCHVLEAAGFQTRSYASVDEFLEAQSSVLRGCFILDVQLPGGASGMELQAELIRRNDHLPIIFLTDHGDISMSVKATKSGAFDFLTKQASPAVLLTSITAAMEEESRIWEVRQKGRDLKKRWETLTHCERHVFSCVVAGMTNKQIGGTVGSTERTIRAHRASVMQKMAVHSIAELVHQAQELGLPMDII